MKRNGCASNSGTRVLTKIIPHIFFVIISKETKESQSHQSIHNRDWLMYKQVTIFLYYERGITLRDREKKIYIKRALKSFLALSADLQVNSAAPFRVVAADEASFES